MVGFMITGMEGCHRELPQGQQPEDGDTTLCLKPFQFRQPFCMQMHLQADSSGSHEMKEEGVAPSHETSLTRRFAAR